MTEEENEPNYQCEACEDEFHAESQPDACPSCGMHGTVFPKEKQPEGTTKKEKIKERVFHENEKTSIAVSRATKQELDELKAFPTMEYETVLIELIRHEKERRQQLDVDNKKKLIELIREEVKKELEREKKKDTHEPL